MASSPQAKQMPSSQGKPKVEDDTTNLMSSLALFASAAAQIDVANKAMTEAYELLIRIDRSNLKNRTLKDRMKDIRFYAREIAVMGAEDILRTDRPFGTAPAGMRGKEKIAKDTPLSKEEIEKLWKTLPESVTQGTSFNDFEYWITQSKPSEVRAAMSRLKGGSKTEAEGRTLLWYAMSAGIAQQTGQTLDEEDKKVLFEKLQKKSGVAASFEQYCEHIDRQDTAHKLMAKGLAKSLRDEEVKFDQGLLQGGLDDRDKLADAFGRAMEGLAVGDESRGGKGKRAVRAARAGGGDGAVKK